MVSGPFTSDLVSGCQQFLDENNKCLPGPDNAGELLPREEILFCSQLEARAEKKHDVPDDMARKREEQPPP